MSLAEFWRLEKEAQKMLEGFVSLKRITEIHISRLPAKCLRAWSGNLAESQYITIDVAWNWRSA